MSELSFKRRQLTQQLALRQRHTYFAQQRTLLLAHYNSPSESPHIAHLRALIHKSMVSNCLLEEVTHRHLLQQLEEKLRESGDSRELELTMVLLANVLIDDLQVREREVAVRLSLFAVTSPLVETQLRTNGSFLVSLGHCLSSVLYSVKFVEEELGVEAEGRVLEGVLEMMGVVMSFAG
jgi:hypothetical protein